MERACSPRAKRELTTFFTVTIVSSWLTWLPVLLAQNLRLSLPFSADLFLRVGTFAPSIVGIVLTLIFGGGTEARLLLRSLLNMKTKPGWLLFSLCVSPGVSAVSCLILLASGQDLPPPQFTPWFLPIAFLYIMVFLGPLGEEAGWRGFALPRMLHYQIPMRSAVSLGLLWSIWHLPLFFISGTTQNALVAFGLVPALLGYLWYTVMLSVLITLPHLLGCGSLLGSILLHTMANLSLGAVPLIFSPDGAIVLLLVLSFVTVAFVYRYRVAMFGQRSQACLARLAARDV